ncbi:MAG: tripartite tricarboxylate transporter substrate binding protein [Hyphomicrobiales bacterium]|nr:tripartite tricarboxylate transporter substrate binding protein [Hyphomicrobiales bacterium]
MAQTLAQTLVRTLALIAFIAAAVPANVAFAQYPTRPVKIIVPNEAGGAYDFVGRLLASGLSERLGRTFFVENRPGGGSVTGTTAAAKAPADGYTLLMGGLSNIAFNPGLYPNLPYDPLRDFTPLALVYTFPYLLVARPGLPHSTLADILAAARRAPNGLSIGTPGVGSAPQVLGAALMGKAGVTFVEVPYKGIQAPFTDLLADRLDLMFASEQAALPYITSGKAKGVAVAAAQRSSRAPGLPTLAEAGVSGLEMQAWLGLFAPASTPPDILARLRTATRDVAAELADRFIKSGGDPMQMEVAATQTFVAQEVARWTAVIRSAAKETPGK